MRHPKRCNEELRSSGMLRGVVFTDVSGQPASLIFKDQGAQINSFVLLDPSDWNILSRNIDKKLPTLDM
jgi:hypothetical protein